jgi:CII-binding regulator of phage lambda lysogenization HflD
MALWLLALALALPPVAGSPAQAALDVLSLLSPQTISEVPISEAISEVPVIDTGVSVPGASPSVPVDTQQLSPVQLLSAVSNAAPAPPASSAPKPSVLPITALQEIKAREAKVESIMQNAEFKLQPVLQAKAVEAIDADVAMLTALVPATMDKQDKQALDGVVVPIVRSIGALATAGAFAKPDAQMSGLKALQAVEAALSVGPPTPVETSQLTPLVAKVEKQISRKSAGAEAAATPPGLTVQPLPSKLPDIGKVLVEDALALKAMTAQIGDNGEGKKKIAEASVLPMLKAVATHAAAVNVVAKVPGLQSVDAQQILRAVTQEAKLVSVEAKSVTQLTSTGKAAVDKVEASLLDSLTAVVASPSATGALEGSIAKAGLNALKDITSGLDLSPSQRADRLLKIEMWDLEKKLKKHETKAKQIKELGEIIAKDTQTLGVLSATVSKSDDKQAAALLTAPLEQLSAHTKIVGKVMALPATVHGNAVQAKVMDALETEAKALASITAANPKLNAATKAKVDGAVSPLVQPLQALAASGIADPKLRSKVLRTVEQLEDVIDVAPVAKEDRDVLPPLLKAEHLLKSPTPAATLNVIISEDAAALHSVAHKGPPPATWRR